MTTNDEILFEKCLKYSLDERMKVADNIFNNIKKNTMNFYKNNTFDSGHSFEHIENVLKHADCMLSEYKLNSKVTPYKILVLKIATLLHDVDDHKFFESSNNMETLIKQSVDPDLMIEYFSCQWPNRLYFKYIENKPELADKFANNFAKYEPYVHDHSGEDDYYTYMRDFIGEISAIISLVSYSKNKNEIDEDLPPEFYIPRYADRIEATGKIGIKRAYEYSKHINRNIIYCSDCGENSDYSENDICEKNENCEKSVSRLKISGR